MSRRFRIAILSDVHYASAAEQARGNDFEYRALKNPLLRFAIANHRRFIWLKDPLFQNARLDEFINDAGSPDWVIANGDYSCDSRFIGVADEASFQSAKECLDKLRQKFAPNFQANFGDHELGKLSFFGGSGGMRLTSLARAEKELGLQTLWTVPVGNYLLVGVTSSLIALPLYQPDILPEEAVEWQQRSEAHLADIRAVFDHLKPEQRVILFCHDPSALPFLWREDAVRNRLAQVEQTIIGHLHSNLVLRTGRVLSGIPPIHFLGHTAKRMTTALAEGKHWRPFNVRLCPSLSGIELLKDGGYYTMELDEAAKKAARFEFHPLKR